MRFSLLFCLVALTCLCGCANPGIIVQRLYRSAPFYDSLGIDGSFTFILRDEKGVEHSQMVTPEVFERYRVGEYFNDLEPVPGPRNLDDSKELRPPFLQATDGMLDGVAHGQKQNRRRESHERLAPR